MQFLIKNIIFQAIMSRFSKENLEDKFKLLKNIIIDKSKVYIQENLPVTRVCRKLYGRLTERFRWSEDFTHRFRKIRISTNFP